MNKIFAVFAVLGFALAAHAAQPVQEVREVRIGRQAGLSYLPAMVMFDQELVQKRARALGLGDVKVSPITVIGAAAANDAMLSGNLDFAVAGVPGVALLKEKTNGRIRASAAFLNSPVMLNVLDPNIRSLRDFKGDAKIALPSVKVSLQAIILQMAVAKEFGFANRNQLDAQTVSMPHPEALAALLSGRSEIKGHFATMPFSFIELKQPGVRTIVNSNDLVGGDMTQIVLYSAQKWKSDNPVFYQAVLAALEDAMTLINSDPTRAAEIYVRVDNSKTPVAEIREMLLRKDQLFYTTTPTRTMPMLEFLAATGFIKTKPTSWKDLFFEDVHSKDGS